MPRVIDAAGAVPHVDDDPAALLVWVGDERMAGPVKPCARIGVSVKDASLARQLMDAMAGAIPPAVPHEHPVVRVVSRKALARLASRLQGVIAVVPLRASRLRHAGELVEALRAAGVAGVQMAWDAPEPPRGAAEARVFAILEQARATPGRPPVVLARGEAVVEALRILVDFRSTRAGKRS